MGVAADTALAWPKLSPETRKALRAKMALGAYMLTNADFILSPTPAATSSTGPACSSR